jgi:hypothetical protein
MELIKNMKSFTINKVHTIEIFQSNNYSDFTFLKENRELRPKHIKDLESEILKNGYILNYAIIVTRNLEIIEGQHRFTACKNLGLPITFQFYKGDEDKILDFIRAINSTAKIWVQKDYISSFAESGNDDFIELLDFEKRHKLTPSNAILIFTNNQKRVTKGEPIRKYDHRELLAVLFNRFKFNFAKTNSFANALRVIINENLPLSAIDYLVENQYQMVQAATRDLYLAQFELILNKRRGRTQKVNLTNK